MVSLHSINANGLRDVNKFRSLCSLLTDMRSDFCLIQETFWSDDFIDDIKHLWNGVIFTSNADNNRAGVAILVDNKWKDKVSEIHKDNSGRTLILEVDIGDIVIKLICIYAPTKAKDRIEYFSYLSNYLTSENAIIGGDFNTTFSHIDRCNTIHNFDSAYDKLSTLISDFDLYDIWRHRNQESKVYSWKRVIQGELKMSRIDFYLVSKNLGNFIKNVFYKHTTLSDHDFIYMKIDFSRIEKGPGVWIFNNTFLKDDNFINEIKSLIELEMKDMLYEREFTVWWDNLKYKIRRKCQMYGQQRNKMKYREYNFIQRQLTRFDANVTRNNFDINKYEQLKDRLLFLEQDLCNGAILRSKAKWAIESDKNTKYFLNLEKYRQSNNCVSELITESGTEVNDTNSILEEEFNYYKKLYSCIDIENEEIDSFLAGVSGQITQEEKLICDRDIEYNEIYEALNSMTRNKSPGSDGLTSEFYLAMWDSLGELLVKLFKQIEADGIMSRTMRYGHITLIYKKGEKKLLKNWRPISLLNVDYKILSRIMSNRFKGVLGGIISPEQSSSVQGRDISDTVASLRDIVDMVENENSNGYLVKIDQEKAFDRVNHTYLNKILEVFGFGPKFCRWIQIFYTQIFSAVKCNGFLTKYFPILNSVRQGCPISAMLFVLTAEPLTQAIKRSDCIHGIPIPGSASRSLIFQHADDTTVTVKDKTSICNVFQVFEKYGRASGAKVNKSKSEVICLGRSTLEREFIDTFDFKICDDVIEVLGVFIGRNKRKSEEKNWRNKIIKIKQLLNIWKQRRLNIQGRATVISTLLVSRLWYTCMVVDIPTWVLTELKTECLRFLWMKKSYPVKYSTIIEDRNLGGLNFPDILTKIKAFRLKFLSKITNPDCKALWKDTFSYFMNNTFKMNMSGEYLYMKYIPKLCKVLPNVYRTMLDAWNELQPNIETIYDNESIFRQPLFLNPRITYNDKVINFECFVRAGITQLKDMTDECVPGILSLPDIRKIILEKCSDITERDINKAYSIICTSIPFEWFQIIHKHTFSSCYTDMFLPQFVLMQNDIPQPLSHCNTSIIYRILRNNIVQEPISRQLWADFSSDFDLKKYGKLIYTVNKCPDMVELDFKIFHNIIYTNKKLFKMNIIDNDTCCMCKSETEDLIHMYIRCPSLRVFRDFIIRNIEIICRYMSNEYIDSLNFDTMFILGLPGRPQNMNYHFLNFFLSLARVCVYKARIIFMNKQKTIDKITFFKYSMEYIVKSMFIYYKNGKEHIFEKHFVRMNKLIKINNGQIVFNW